MVEEANPTHISEIYALIASEPKYLLPRTVEDITENIHNFVVIKEEGKIVACASFEDYAPKITEIRSVIILPAYRKKGYGTDMIKLLMKRAKQGQEIFVVTSSVTYFKKLGFHNCLNEKQVLFYQKTE